MPAVAGGSGSSAIVTLKAAATVPISPDRARSGRPEGAARSGAHAGAVTPTQAVDLARRGPLSTHAVGDLCLAGLGAFIRAAISVRPPERSFPPRTAVLPKPACHIDLARERIGFRRLPAQISGVCSLGAVNARDWHPRHQLRAMTCRSPSIRRWRARRPAGSRPVARLTDRSDRDVRHYRRASQPAGRRRSEPASPMLSTSRASGRDGRRIPSLLTERDDTASAAPRAVHHSGCRRFSIACRRCRRLHYNQSFRLVRGLLAEPRGSLKRAMTTPYPPSASSSPHARKPRPPPRLRRARRPSIPLTGSLSRTWISCCARIFDRSAFSSNC